MKLSQCIGIFLISVTAAFGGYWLGGHVQNSGTFLAAKSLPQLDYVVVPDSFSRIENARQDLEGLCARLRLEIETRLCEQRRVQLQAGVSSAAQTARLDRIIRDLEDGMNEFEGTDQKLYVAEDLLCVLKREEHYNRWVEVYLRALYEHPMHPLVSRFAAEAITMGKQTGRESDVLSALTHLSSIPLDFQGKEKIEAALLGARGSRPLASMNYSLELPITN